MIKFHQLACCCVMLIAHSPVNCCMSLLPNFKLAEIANEKIYDYCLNPYHERGQHKARVFRKVLGITYKDGELLKSAILSQLGVFEVSQMRQNNFGTIYTLPLKISIFDKEAELITVWIIMHNSSIPRLVTCYINT